MVIRIGAGLLFPGKGGDDGAAQTPQSRTSQSQGFAQRVTSKFGGDSELLHTIVTAGVVTWCNPQAIIDGTLMLGAFSATLTVGQSTPFITGVETASALWFFGITLLVSLFSHKFSPRIVTAMNRVCGAVVVLYGVKLLADFDTQASHYQNFTLVHGGDDTHHYVDSHRQSGQGLRLLRRRD